MNLIYLEQNILATNAAHV